MSGWMDAAAFPLHYAPTLRENDESLLFRWHSAQYRP